jgi:DNA replication protein DnaC
MLDHMTVQKLQEMKLTVMAAKFREQVNDNAAKELGFEERFGCLVDAEWAARKSNRMTRLIRKAAFEFPGACLENVEYHADRKLDQALIVRLGTCSYIKECRNIIILGATGNGQNMAVQRFRHRCMP